MVETRSDAEAQRKVLEMIRGIEVAMMVTMDEEGRFRGRPMRAAQAEFDGALWFFTRATSPVALEVSQDDRVLLAYSDPRRQDYVSVFGSAELVRDREKQKALWSEPLRTWFPGGPEDHDVALVKVTVKGAEYWDAPSSTLVHAFGYLKSVTTGEPPHPGANDKVDFSRRTG
ncbi:pyridoxamine 5'-phosphate oxidase family protein [Crenalkalicoccus roseus]|uniref:pyridoxamine 5'-phosphate oxidase family protein n=1 Tax=Crenalkalicoccus roseus TaxID=1485588 RepID=UPI00108109B1|nr:pyridoxamine 5'-phosphate oxidase family protein [Crenalkalicoccus roseus]